MSEEELCPSARIKKLEGMLKRKRSIQAIRTAVSQVLNAKPADIKEFSHKIGNHKWRGIIYQRHNSLMGTIVSFFDNKLFIVRGYPKIKYADDSRVYNRECITQAKLDGTNLGIFRLPDGTITGKTRLTEGWSKFAYKNKNLTYEGLLKSVNNGKLFTNIEKLLKEHDYVVFGELYGKLNPGDFIKYTIDIDFKVFDILDRKSHTFFPPEKVKEICSRYDLPIVEETWRGVLTDKEIQRIELELKKEVKEDGFEGWVAKAYFPEENDCYFAKLKCEEIKEKAWEGSKATIPTGIIRKAIRKTFENYPSCKTIESMEPYVIEELKEDVENRLIESSIEKIRAQIRWALTPSDEDLFELVLEKMKEMKARGINLRNKSHVLSNLASALGTISGGKLFTLYNQALNLLEKD